MERRRVVEKMEGTHVFVGGEPFVPRKLVTAELTASTVW